MSARIYRGFTLAEVAIVLMVLGILTAVLLPTAIKNMPDENVLKFRKGNATFATVIKTLSESEKYFLNGDFSQTPAGVDITTTYFCEAFADNVSVKSKTCNGTKYADRHYHLDVNNPYSTDDTSISTQKNNADLYCSYSTESDNIIITTDNIAFYEACPASSFAAPWSSGGWLFKPGIHKDAHGLNRTYKVFCIDVDGINNGEAPFGYGVRADGKILPGARADEWMNKKITREN